MPGRSVWTRPMLERLQELHRQGHNERDITNTLFLEFGAPSMVGETKAELMMLKNGMLYTFPVDWSKWHAQNR